MEFTKDNIAKSWYILNHNSQEEKKEADHYLTEFKVQYYILIKMIEIRELNGNYR